MRDVQRFGGGRRLRGGPGKRVNELFPGQSQSFRHQRRPVIGRLQPRTRGNGAGRRNKGQNVSYGEMSRCRESEGWMPERDGKDEGKDSPKQAGSCLFARHS